MRRSFVHFIRPVPCLALMLTPLLPACWTGVDGACEPTNAAAGCADGDYSPGPGEQERDALGEGLGGGAESTEIGAVIDTFCGIPAYQNGPDIEHVESMSSPFGYRHQCTELAYRFTCEHFALCDQKVGAYGHAKSWYPDTYNDPVLTQMTRFPNGGTEPPRPGDILASDVGGYGHVAIVKLVDNEFVHVLEQNVYNGSHAYEITVDDGHYIMAAKWQGWMRAPNGPADCGGEQPGPDDMPSCVTGSFMGQPVVDGSILHAAGTIGASKGVLRYSLVVDETTVFSLDPVDPLPTAQGFDHAVDLSTYGLAPGAHTLGLWVKDADQCTGGAAVDAAEIVIEEADEGCVPDDHTVCSGGDVHWADSCGAIGGLAEACGGDSACVELSATNADCQVVPILCGDGTLDPDEDCDGADLGGASCASEGLGSGVLTCGATCQYDTSDCCAANDHSDCYQGDVVWFDSCGQPGDVKETCEDGCEGGACAPDCAEAFAVTANECPDYSSANGSGPGGGELMAVCGSIDEESGAMTMRAVKQPNDENPLFGTRPYQVRVSSASDDPCGPETHFFEVSDDAPSGIGSDELEFQFQSVWKPGQTEKAYCVTASTKAGDLDYQQGNVEQSSWWWSDKVVVTRSACP